MSNVSLSTYVSRAREKLDGEVRVARGTKDQVVNKGTFGHSVASLFEDIGRALGFVRPDPTLAKRQNDALEGFKKTLTSHFGEDVARLALEQAKLFDKTGVAFDNVTLTGRVILETTQHARAILQGNRIDNQQNVEKFRPAPTGEEPSEGFTRIAQGMAPPLDPKGLTTDQKVAFHMRLEDSIRSESELGRTKLGEEKVEALARQALKEVLKLSQTGGLDKAERARDAYTDSIKNLLRVVARAGDPQTLLNAMLKCHDRFQDYVKAEGRDVGGDDVRAMEQRSMFEAMQELSTEHPGLLSWAQVNLQTEDSPFKALYSVCQEQRYDTTNNSVHQARMAGLLSGFSESLVVNLAKALVPRTQSGFGDVAKLDDGKLKPETRESVREVFTQTLEPFRYDTEPGKAFFSEVLRDFSGIVPRQGEVLDDENQLFSWGKSSQMLERLEERVQAYSQEKDILTFGAVEDFREAFKTIDMHPGLRAKLMAGLDAILEDHTLDRELRDHEPFEGLGEGEIWRLFAPGYLQDRGVSKWDLEIHNEGSLAGMNRMLLSTLWHQKQGQELDGDHLLHLHELGARGSHNERLQSLFQPGPGYEDPESHLHMRVDTAMPPGLRAEPVMLSLHLGTETTPEGMEELRQYMENDPWFVNSREIDGEEPVFEVNLRKPPSDEECKTRLDKILGDYKSEIGQAQTDDDKLRAIGRAVQGLYRSHLFSDGNTRTLVNTAMNRMLLDQGLTPSILKYPKAAAGFSLDQFVEQIRLGQQTFQGLKGG